MAKPHSKKVVLFFPPYASNEAEPPLALAALAAPLLSAGFQVRIIDGALDRDYVRLVLAEMQDALCLGISLCTGPMIHGAMEVSRAVKEKYPDKSIIFGGWHPSLLPEQTIQFADVDLVVVKQGELTFLEIVQRLAAGESCRDVAGTLSKDHGRIQINPERPYTPIAQLPSRVPGYALHDYDRYERHSGLRTALYLSSHGCPYRCGYCCNATVYGQRYDALPAEQVVAETTFLVRQYRLQVLGILDDIFFSYRPRSLQIAEGFIKSETKFKWFAQDRTDSWEKLTADQAKLYRRAGLIRVHFGAESGSESVLESVNKKAKISSLWAALDRCRAADIRATFNIIFGFPKETPDDVRETLRMLNEIQRIYPNSDFYTNIYTPYPGAPLWEVAVQAGVYEPQRFEEWADIIPRTSTLPWLKGRALRRLQTIRRIIYLAYPALSAKDLVSQAPKHWVGKIFRKLAKFRMRKFWFAFPVDMALFRALIQLRNLFRAILPRHKIQQP